MLFENTSNIFLFSWSLLSRSFPGAAEKLGCILRTWILRLIVPAVNLAPIRVARHDK